MSSREESTESSDASGEAELIHAHLAAVAWIEAHLFEPMSVKSIAERAGYSPSRFSRGFTRIQGESVMSYVRGRRLEEAVSRLLKEPDLRIVDLAFDSGFDSQEAFTRAFVRAFGHPPGRLRGLGPVRGVMRQKKATRGEPDIHQRLEQIPDLHLAGLVLRVTPANGHEIPRLWERLGSLRDFHGVLDSNVYSVILDGSPFASGVDVMAAVRVRSDAEIPSELHTLRLPCSTCSVFRHTLRKGDVFPQISAARDWIYAQPAERLPLDQIRFPVFEVFPNGLRVTPGSWIDYYFPLKE